MPPARFAALHRQQAAMQRNQPLKESFNLNPDFLRSIGTPTGGRSGGREQPVDGHYQMSTCGMMDIKGKDTSVAAG